MIAPAGSTYQSFRECEPMMPHAIAVELLSTSFRWSSASASMLQKYRGFFSLEFSLEVGIIKNEIT